MVKGKYTLISFKATWCGPCKRVEPKIREIAEAYPDDIALRIIDIGSWGSPVARLSTIRWSASAILTWAFLTA